MRIIVKNIIQDSRIYIAEMPYKEAPVECHNKIDNELVYGTKHIVEQLLPTSNPILVRLRKFGYISVDYYVDTLANEGEDIELIVSQLRDPLI